MSGLDAARARVLESGGPELLERLDHLDSLRRQGRELRAATARTAPSAPPAPEAGDAVDFDVAIVGGGLWSLLAPLLAQHGLRVAVFDRARAAVAHREWNASGPELATLVEGGLVTDAELSRLVVARYDHGICRFHGGQAYPVAGVLDQAVEAGPLLAAGRALAERRAVTFFDGYALESQSAGRGGVRLRFSRAHARAGDGQGDGASEVTARIMVDARGAASPYASADLVCPTVGGVMRGLVEGDAPDEMNPRVGEILATVDGIEGGRQHVWEAFPGRPGETTVYLFFYARSSEPVSLARLYARFFDTLVGYKRGDAVLVRPTFGFIPGWSRLTPAPRAPHGRFALVGDAAARHSPLTYCGFGATLRSLGPAAAAISRAVHEPSPDLRHVVHDAPVHALTGALAHMMSSRVLSGDELNGLLDAAFRTLHEMGCEPYARLLRDEMSPASFLEFLRRTAARHPAVWGKVMRGLGAASVGRWGVGLARSMLARA